jgi:hypothetical protein
VEAKVRGHENLIALRKRGMKPNGMVWMCDYPVKPEVMDWIGEHMNPTVCVDGDDLESLDLRFLIGMPVNVTGDDKLRVRRLSVLAVKAGAKLVTAFAGDHGAMWREGDAKWQTF